jgi:hypothetical protein
MSLKGFATATAWPVTALRRRTQRRPIRKDRSSIVQFHSEAFTWAGRKRSPCSCPSLISTEGL